LPDLSISAADIRDKMHQVPHGVHLPQVQAAGGARHGKALPKVQR